MATYPNQPPRLDEFEDSHFGKDEIPGKISIKPCGTIVNAVDITLTGQTLELRCNDSVFSTAELPFTLPERVLRCYKKCPDPLAQPHAGQRILNNPQFVDVMDTQAVFLDDDGSLSFYLGTNRTLLSNPTWKFLTGGGELNNVAIKDAINDGRVVAFENGYIFFVNQANGTLDFYLASTGVFDAALSATYSAANLSGGPLAGPMKNAIAGSVAGWKFLGAMTSHIVFYNDSLGQLASYWFNNTLLYDSSWSMGGTANPSLTGGAFQGPLKAAMQNFIGISEDRISFINPQNGNWLAYSMATRAVVWDAIGQPMLPLCQTAECSDESCVLDTGLTVARSFVISQGYTITPCATPTPPPTGGTDAQTLSIAGQALTISNGNTVTLPTPVVPDFWTSSVSAANTVANPDGTNDLTEVIRRDGLVGINTRALTHLDVNGSFSANHRLIPNATTAYTVAPEDYTVSFDGSTTVPNPLTTKTCTLPAAASFPRRIISVVLAQGNLSNNITINSAGGLISDIDGPAVTSVSMVNDAIRAMTFQSDGVNWQLIGSSRARRITHLHRLVLGDFPAISVFNGETYTFNDWIPAVLSESHSPAMYVQTTQTAGLQWTQTTGGLWQLNGDQPVINDRWIITVSFEKNRNRVIRRFGNWSGGWTQA